MKISSCGILFDLPYLDLYHVLQADGMVGSGVWCVTTIGAGELILRPTLRGA